MSTRGFRDRYAIDDKIQFVDFSSRELQDRLTPAEALDYLLAGNRRFRDGQRLKRDLSRQVAATAKSQHPMAVVLSCIDSRTPAELIFDLGLGDIFSVRVAGNIVTPEVLGSIEFGCVEAQAKLIVVVGHTRCIAVQAAVDRVRGVRNGDIQRCEHVQPIIASLETLVSTSAAAGGGAADSAAEPSDAVDVVRRNVERSVAQVIAKSGTIRDLLESGRAGIVGMVYDVETGGCELLPTTIHGLQVSENAAGATAG